MPMSHGANKKDPAIVFHSTSLPNQVFTRFVRCLTRNTLSTFFLLWSNRLLQKLTHFKVKQISSLNVLLVSFHFAVFVYMWFLGHFFTVLQSWMALCLDICKISYLTSHQIMWHNKRIHGHGFKIRSCCCSYVFQGK